MRTFLRITLLALAFALGTVFIAWWSIPLLALIWGVIARRVPRVAVTAGAGALMAWAVLLALSASAEGFGVLVASLTQVMQLPSVALVVLTLLFAALLAWSAARLSATIAMALLDRGAPDELQRDGNGVTPPDDAGSSAGDRPRAVYAAK